MSEPKTIRVLGNGGDYEDWPNPKYKEPSSFAAPACSADERLQSLRREGWKNTWMATVLRSGDEIAVVFPDGTYFRGVLVSLPNDQAQRRRE